MGKPTECVRAMLDERGVTYDEKSVDGGGTLFSINLLEQCDDYTSSIFVYNTYIEVMRKYLTPEQAIAATLGESRSCAACPEMGNPGSYIFHLMRALEHERGCCRDCKHSHMTADGKHCKWCSVLATHKIDGEGCCDPSNGYDPEPYFDAGFHCGFFERRVSE